MGSFDVICTNERSKTLRANIVEVMEYRDASLDGKYGRVYVGRGSHCSARAGEVSHTYNGFNTTDLPLLGGPQYPTIT